MPSDSAPTPPVPPPPSYLLPSSSPTSTASSQPPAQPPVGAAHTLTPIDTHPAHIPSNDPRNPGPLLLSQPGSAKRKSLAAAPTKGLGERRSRAPQRLYAPHAKPGDSTHFVNTLRDFDRFLRSLPIPLHRLVPSIVARVICRVFRAQGIMASSIAFDIALFFWRIIINLFFREIRPRSAWRVPREGPVIFVAAPHHNQFLDPLLLASEVRRASGRRVAFLIAEKSIKRRFIGTAARIMQSIPVARAADSAKPGKGTISVHPSGDSLLIQGHGTAFKSQVMPKGQIMLPKATGHATAEVVEVISDTELRIKKEFKDQRAIDALNGKIPTDPRSKGAKKSAEKEIAAPKGPGCTYHCLPFVDQTQMYASVYERLAEGGCIGIFPEGGSHDRTDLLPLKAGVVIMALGAMSANQNLNVRIVPVGMSYFHPHKFRSRAVVEFGSPIDVPRELVSQFDEGGEGKKKAVGSMMDIVYDGLKAVTLRAPDYETLMVVQAGRRLYRPTGQSLSLGQTVELNRKFIMGYLKFKDEPRVMKLREDILRYNKMLKYAGLRDHQVERATRAGWRSLGLLAYRLGLLGLWGGLALPGAVLNSPIIVLAKIISHKKAKEALAASQVKVAGRDVLATWKVLVSLGVAPVLYSFYAGVATYLAHRSALPPRHQALMPLYTLIVLPTMSYSALKFAEVGIDIYKSLPPLFVSLLPGNHKVILDLQQTRAKISADMHALIDELAPLVWDDFQKTRILPSAEAPPAAARGNASVVWKPKRKDSADVLSHPFQWLDERLFGWDRRRGSSTRRVLTAEEIRTRFSKERAASDAANDEAVEDDEDQELDEDEDSSFTSCGEDDEDDGDYEAIFSMLPGSSMFGAKSPATPGGRRSRSHSRSRSGSAGETFAEKRNRSNQDLRALMREGGAMSPAETRKSFMDKGNGTATSPVSKTTALPGRNGESSTWRRQRTHSLSEDVHVEELKAAGPKSRSVPFSAASQAFEVQHSLEGTVHAGAKPALEHMKSAEITPSATPPRTSGALPSLSAPQVDDGLRKKTSEGELEAKDQ